MWLLAVPLVWASVASASPLQELRVIGARDPADVRAELAEQIDKVGRCSTSEPGVWVGKLVFREEGTPSRVEELEVRGEVSDATRICTLEALQWSRLGAGEGVSIVSVSFAWGAGAGAELPARRGEVGTLDFSFDGTPPVPAATPAADPAADAAFDALLQGDEFPDLLVGEGLDEDQVGRVLRSAPGLAAACAPGVQGAVAFTAWINGKGGITRLTIYAATPGIQGQTRCIHDALVAGLRFPETDDGHPVNVQAVVNLP